LWTSQTLRMRALTASGAGFLLAVLWFDLMFDVQVRGHPARAVPVGVRESIAAYYARVTTAARPMNRLIAFAMLLTLGAQVAELVRDDLPTGRVLASLAFTVAAVGLAALRTVRNAVRLGTEAEDAEQQSRLAHLMLRDHLTCFGGILVVLLLQVLPV